MEIIWRSGDVGLFEAPHQTGPMLNRASRPESELLRCHLYDVRDRVGVGL